MACWAQVHDQVKLAKKAKTCSHYDITNIELQTKH